MNIPVVKPYKPDQKKYQKLVSGAFERSWFTNNGPLLAELEQRLENYLGVKNVICVANCTIGLQVLYKALGLKCNVLTTPFSYIATRSSLEWEGLSPVFADICPDTWNLSTDCVELIERHKPSAILGVHVFGNPCDVRVFDKIGTEQDLPVIYDAAHAFDVKLEGESVLNFGTGSVLSFHATKLFHTIEGGAIVVDCDQLADKIRALIRFGQVTINNQSILGINAKLSEFHAAMGLAVLDEIETIIYRRQTIYAHYSSELKAYFSLQSISNDVDYNYAYFPMLFKSTSALLECISCLEEHKIFPRRYFFPSLERYSTRELINCPYADDIASRILCLPIYPDLDMKNVKKICDIVKKFAH